MTLLSLHFPPQLILLLSGFKYIIPSNKLLVYRSLTYLRSKSPTCSLPCGGATSLFLCQATLFLLGPIRIPDFRFWVYSHILLPPKYLHRSKIRYTVQFSSWYVLCSHICSGLPLAEHHVSMVTDWENMCSSLFVHNPSKTKHISAGHFLILW